jgi:hypothetical protein
MICRKCSFQKLTQLSEGNNVVDAEASIRDTFLSGYTCASSTQQNRPIWSKQPISTLKHIFHRKYCIQKRSQFAQGNNRLDAAASNTDVFHWRDTGVSSTWINRPI